MDIIVGDEPQLRGWAWGPAFGYSKIGETRQLSQEFNPFGMAEPEQTSFLYAKPAQAENLLRQGHQAVYLLSDHGISDMFSTSVVPTGYTVDKARIGITGVNVLTPVNAGNRLAGLRNTVNEWLRLQN